MKYNSGKQITGVPPCDIALLNYDNNDDSASGSVLSQGVFEEDKKIPGLVSPWFQHFKSQHHLSGISSAS